MFIIAPHRRQVKGKWTRETRKERLNRRGGSGAFKGRYFMTSPGKPLHTRRGEGWVVQGGDACVALVLFLRVSAPPARRTQASPHHCTPLPPLRMGRSAPQKAYP